MPSAFMCGLNMKAGVQHLAAHVQLGLAPQKCFQGGSIWPCLLYTHSKLPHNTAKFLFGRVRQASAYFQDVLKETQAHALSRSYNAQGLHGHRRKCYPAGLCPAIRQSGSRTCVEPSSLGSDITAPQSYPEYTHMLPKFVPRF